MKYRNYIILISLLLMGIYLFSHDIFLSDKKRLKMTPVPVAVAPVIEKNIVITEEVIGQVEPYANVIISPQISGQLQKVNFQEGEHVQKDQLLFEIDPRPYQAKLIEAQGALENSKAQLNNVKLILERYTPLEKKGYVSKQDFEQAKANVIALQATVQANEAAVEQAKLSLAYCYIRAPISGKTGNILMKAGNIVTANSTTLVTINQIDPIYVRFHFPEKELQLVQKAFQEGSVMIKVATAPHQYLQGKLTFIDNTIDVETNTIQLKATFFNQSGLLWPGESVRVFVPIRSLAHAVIVPASAVQQGQQGSYVYLLKNNAVVSYQPVLTTAQVPEGLIITHGLHPGDKVVTAGQLRLNDGTPVTVSSS